jgi:hypothetical protein
MSTKCDLYGRTYFFHGQIQFALERGKILIISISSTKEKKQKYKDKFEKTTEF